MNGNEALRILQRARDYCDNQVGCALYDPKRTPDHERAQDYQHAAAILDKLAEQAEHVNPDA